MQSPFYIFVDVDDTFARYDEAPWIPLSPIIEHVKGLAQRGAVLYGWSSQGAEDARRRAREFGIEDCFRGFLPKPNGSLTDEQLSKLRDLLEKSKGALAADSTENPKQPSARQHPPTAAAS